MASRNAIKSLSKQREALQQQLKELIREKRTEVERYSLKFNDLRLMAYLNLWLNFIDIVDNENIHQRIFNKFLWVSLLVVFLALILLSRYTFLNLDGAQNFSM